MRILNTDLKNTKIGKFTLPGFRSGSVLKKIIACLYYFSVMIFMIVYTITFIKKANFAAGYDLVFFALSLLLLFAIFLTPVIAIGLSDYYDWHGIKLFLIIMISWCILYTACMWIGTLFSDEFLNSVNSSDSITVNTEKSDNKPADIDSEIINKNINESKKSGGKSGGSDASSDSDGNAHSDSSAQNNQ